MVGGRSAENSPDTKGWEWFDNAARLPDTSAGNHIQKTDNKKAPWREDLESSDFVELCLVLFLSEER